MDNWLIAGLTALISAAVAWGLNLGWRESVDKKLEKHDKWHAEHFDHKDDEDAHFTKRERDDLTKWREGQDRKLDEIHKAIQDLTQRMYGK